MPGRQKGTRNKVTQANIDLAHSFDMTPLEHMLTVLNDPDTEPNRKDEMAKAAAPYVHPKLLATRIEGDVNVTNESAQSPGISRVHEILAKHVSDVIEGELADPGEDGSLLPAALPAPEA